MSLDHVSFAGYGYGILVEMGASYSWSDASNTSILSPPAQKWKVQVGEVNRNTAQHLPIPLISHRIIKSIHSLVIASYASNFAIFHPASIKSTKAISTCGFHYSAAKESRLLIALNRIAKYATICHKLP